MASAPSFELMYNFIPRNRSSFFDNMSSGFIVPVSTFFNKVTFSLIFCPSCSCVIPFLFLPSLITLGNSGSRMISSVRFIFFWGGGLFLGMGLILLGYGLGFDDDDDDEYGEYCDPVFAVVFVFLP